MTRRFICRKSVRTRGWRHRAPLCPQRQLGDYSDGGCFPRQMATVTQSLCRFLVLVLVRESRTGGEVLITGYVFKGIHCA